MDRGLDLSRWMDLSMLRMALGLCVFGRFSGFIFTAPIFSHRSVPVMVKAGFAAALTMVVTPLLPAPAHNTEGYLVAGMIKEILFGALMGWTVNLIYSCGQMAGEWLDLSGGFQSARMFNPATEAMSSPISGMKGLVAGLVFLNINAHAVVVRAAARSFDISHAGALSIDAGTASGWAGLVAQVVWISVQIAAPVGIALFLSEVAFGIANRALPQMNMMLIMMPAKCGLVVGGLALAMPVLRWMLETTFSNIPDTLASVMRLVAG